MVVEVAAHLAESGYLNAGDVRAAPGGEFTVAVLTNDERVDRARIDSYVFAEIEAQTSRIQHRTGTENAVVRQTGELLRGVGQDIDRVRYDQQDAFEIALGDLGDDRLEYAYVLFNEVEASLAGLLSRSGCDDNDRAVADIVVVAGVYLAGL